MQTGETTIRASRSLVHWHGHPRKGPFGPARESQGRPGPATHGRDAHATGFTLTEIMIAMGVLAVGMAMVAGALHAGIQVHIRTIDDIMRQLIGDNSLAMVQARVRHTTGTGNLIPASTASYKWLKTGTGADCYFGPGDLQYPWNTAGTPYGAAVLMRRRVIDATTSTFANDYDVIIVPYTIIRDTTSLLGTVSPTDMPSSTVAAGTPGSTVTVTSAGVLKVGSVVIDNRSTQVSVVQSVTNTTTVVLRDTLTAGNGTGVTLTTMTVSNSGTGGRLECSKPIQTKTALSPAPPGWTPGSN
jgi:prepilin-type N-terminal cleavage/methylation domain-containing protein